MAKSSSSNWLLLAALMLLVAAAIGGWLKQAPPPALAPFELLPTVVVSEKRSDQLTVAWADSSRRECSGFIATGQGNGYGGPLLVAVVADPVGKLLSIRLLKQNETPVFLNRWRTTEPYRSFLGADCATVARSGLAIEAVTGATLTATAVNQAVASAAYAIAVDGLHQSPIPRPNSLRFGLREWALLVLFILALNRHRFSLELGKLLHWGLIVSGILVIGYIYAVPLTLGRVATMLMGLWPDWQSAIYWYLLLGGIFIPLIVWGRTPYCESLCPFGGLQECLGVLGGARRRGSVPQQRNLIWLGRLLAFSLLVWALWTRDAGVTTHEVFSTAFRLIGTTLQFILMALVVITALFYRRPWCRTLCPLRAMTDGILALRRMLSARPDSSPNDSTK